MNPSLTIITPIYNPPKGWNVLLLDRFKELSQALSSDEIGLVLVNDGSSMIVDDLAITLLKSEIPNFHYIHYPNNKGKGYALRKGVESANTNHCIYTDFDFPYTLESMLRMEEALNHSDVVLGLRSSTYYDHLPDKRKKLSLRLQKLVKILTGLPIADTQAGLKGFNRKGKKVFLKTRIHRFLFDLEFVDLAFNESRVNVSTVEIALRPNIEFTSFNKTILMKEMKNFVLLLMKMNGRRFRQFFARK